MNNLNELLEQIKDDWDEEFKEGVKSEQIQKDKLFKLYDAIINTKLSIFQHIDDDRNKYEKSASSSEAEFNKFNEKILEIENTIKELESTISTKTNDKEEQSVKLTQTTENVVIFKKEFETKEGEYQLAVGHISAEDAIEQKVNAKAVELNIEGIEKEIDELITKTTEMTTNTNNKNKELTQKQEELKGKNKKIDENKKKVEKSEADILKKTTEKDAIVPGPAANDQQPPPPLTPDQEAKKKSLEEDITKIKEHIKSTQEENTNIETEKTTIEGEITNLQDEISKIKQENDVLNQDISTKKAELNQKKTEKEAYENELKKLKKEKEDAETKLQQETSTKETIEKSITELEETINKTEENLKEQQNKLDTPEHKEAIKNRDEKEKEKDMYYGIISKYDTYKEEISNEPNVKNIKDARDKIKNIFKPIEESKTKSYIDTINSIKKIFIGYTVELYKRKQSEKRRNELITALNLLIDGFNKENIGKEIENNIDQFEKAIKEDEELSEEKQKDIISLIKSVKRNKTYAVNNLEALNTKINEISAIYTSLLVKEENVKKDKAAKKAQDKADRERVAEEKKKMKEMGINANSVGSSGDGSMSLINKHGDIVKIQVTYGDKTTKTYEDSELFDMAKSIFTGNLDFLSHTRSAIAQDFDINLLQGEDLGSKIKELEQQLIELNNKISKLREKKRLIGEKKSLDEQSKATQQKVNDITMGRSNTSSGGNKKFKNKTQRKKRKAKNKTQRKK